MTGGDNSNIKQKIIKFLNNDTSNQYRSRSNGVHNLSEIINTEYPNFWGEKNKGAFYYLDISKLENKYNIDIEDMYSSKSAKSVGKGEYLLPLLYHDVYKSKVSNIDNNKDSEEFSVGDNFILKDANKPITNDNKYHLELKAPNASLKFIGRKEILKYIQENGKYIEYNKEDENIDENYKKVIAASFLKYAKYQNNYRKNLFLCIFNEEKGIPVGILFINISNITNEDINPKSESTILKTFKNLIVIDSDNISPNKDFSYTLTLNDKGNPILKCSLYKNYLTDNIINDIIEKNQKNESKILSRDNFVNEIYTK